MHTRGLALCLMLAGCRGRAPEAQADPAPTASVAPGVAAAHASSRVASAPAIVPPFASASASASASAAPSASLSASARCLPVPAGVEPGQNVDLDGDGTDDAIRALYGDSDLHWGVFLVRGGCGVRVELLEGSSVAVSKRKTKGVRDLETASICRHLCCDVVHVTWKWNGSEYRSASYWSAREGCIPDDY
jgi:hypothetical protein